MLPGTFHTDISVLPTRANLGINHTGFAKSAYPVVFLLLELAMAVFYEPSYSREALTFDDVLLLPVTPRLCRARPMSGRA